MERSQAANAGLNAARGELLIFLDDDDWYLPHHIARLKVELDRVETAVAAYSAISCVDESGKEIKSFAEPFDSIRLCFDNYIPVHAVLFKRWVIDKGLSFDVTLPLYEHWDFWLQLLEQGTFHFVPEIGAKYRIEQGEDLKNRWDTDLARKAMISIYLKWMPRWNEETLWALMNSVRENEVRKLHEQQLIDLRKELEEAKRTLALYDQKNETSLETIRRCQETLNEQRHQLSCILDSKSWRFTRPLREIRQFFSKVL